MPAGYTNLQLGARNAFHLDASNNKWIGFYLIGLGRFDGSNWTMFDTTNSTIPSNQVNALASNNTTLWVGTLKGLSKYDGTTFTNFDNTNSLLPNSKVTAVAVNGNIVWAGTNSGLYKYDGSTWQGYTISNGLVNDTIQCISINPLGDVWIGTKNGLSYFSNNSFTNYTTLNSNLESNNILCVTITNSNEIWIGTKGAGAYKFWNGSFISTVNLVLRNIHNCVYESNLGGDVYSIISDAASNVYFALPTYYFGKNILKVSGSSGIICMLKDTSNKFNGLRVRLQSDASGNLWLCDFPPTSSNNYYYSLDLNSLSGKDINQSKWAGSDDLNINQVSARMLNLGDMHWDPVSQINHYEVPVCSGKNSVYTSAIWLGGLDAGNNLHTAAMTYRQQGAYDFFAGPLDTITGVADSANLATYDRLWKVDRNMIYLFQQNFLNGNVTNGTYPIPEPILNWPAQGTGNYTRNLAPFIDYNTDGIYNPYDGDYPEITGDQMLWWVFNDTLAPHTETNGAAFGFEIQGKAYAFTCPTISTIDEAINYTTFYQYKIINRSPNTYHDMYIGLWTDNDLGNAADDYVGCDTLLNAGFAYNGDNDDEGASGYGINPPMQNCMILKGPLADPGDGIDNNHNGTIDEQGETIGISHFVFYVSVNGVPNSNPAQTDDYYDYLKGTWLNGWPITYGGDGLSNQSNPPTNFMFSGTPYDTAWTMANAGIAPDDMRLVMSAGKFTIAPGEERTIDFAYVFTRDSTAPNGLTTSIAKNTADLIKVHQWFDNNNFPSCFNVGVNEIKKQDKIIVYPNPATTILQLKNIDANKKIRYSISDVTGRVCLEGIYYGAIDIHKLKTQLYLLRLDDGTKISYTKFVKL